MQLFRIALLLCTIAGINGLRRRQTDGCNCASNAYTSGQVNAGQAQGYSLYERSETVGSDKYPHVYHDYEGFTFPVDGPYYEFPILASGEVYDGGNPGPDRVIFNEEDQLAGCITHTGASGDNFLQCTFD